jgi:hypothetical protein
VRWLALLLALALGTPAVAADLKAMRDRARKAPAAEAPDRWFELAQESRVISRLNQGVSLKLLDEENRIIEKSDRTAMFREALGHLDPMHLSMLAAELPSPDISAAMVRAMRERGRMDEAATECRSALGRWTAGDVPVVVEACRDCRSQFAYGAGAASFPVFSHWLAVEDDGEYHRGLLRAMGPMMPRVKVMGLSEVSAFRREFVGVVIGDPASHAATLAHAFQVPFVALMPGAWPRDSTRSAVPIGSRVLVPRPGPNALAERLLESAKRQGAKKIVLVRPDEGGNVELAHALERAAGQMETVSYVAGRREHREDARRVRATGADAVVLLGPADESADWLPALRSGGSPLLVLGTDELDPQGFHEQARRALEGAIYVRTFWTPADTTSWTDASSSAFIAGWAIGRAILAGADSPHTLAVALEKDVSEQDASFAWFLVPREVATIDVFRVKGGKAEKLP